jgi:hypothetical protein
MGKVMQAGQYTMTHTKLTPVDLNEGFVVAIEIDSKPGEEEAVANGLTALIEPTMAEPCELACNNDPLRGVFRVQSRPL